MRSQLAQRSPQVQQFVVGWFPLSGGLTPADIGRIASKHVKVTVSGKNSLAPGKERANSSARSKRTRESSSSAVELTMNNAVSPNDKDNNHADLPEAMDTQEGGMSSPNYPFIRSFPSPKLGVLRRAPPWCVCLYSTPGCATFSKRCACGSVCSGSCGDVESDGCASWMTGKKNKKREKKIGSECNVSVVSVDGFSFDVSLPVALAHCRDLRPRLGLSCHRFCRGRPVS